MKSVIFLTLAFFTFISAYAQSKEILVKSAISNAEEAYSNENYDECFIYLSEAEKILGKTNSMIQYLKVKAWMAVGNNSKNNLTAWQKAETELKKYFEVTSENDAAPEKYDDMVLSVSKVKHKIQELEVWEKSNRKIMEQLEVENQLWNETKKQNTIRDYTNYIIKYPNGQYIGEARGIILKFFVPLWMTKNLDVDRFRNGEKISKKFYSGFTENLPAFGFHYYSKEKVFSKLYNYYAISDPRGLCPAGWHVPTLEEWSVLIAVLGGKDVAGGKLKEQGTSHWRSPNSGASDDINFAALPDGYISIYQDSYYNIMEGEEGYWWSSDKYIINISFDNPGVSIRPLRPDFNPADGFSVRCVKDF